MRPNPIVAAPAILAVTLGLAVGCSANKVKLEGAVYAAQSPVYPAANYEDTMGGASHGDEGAASESMSWFFKTQDPVEEVEAFYRAKLPSAQRGEKETEDGVTVTCTFVPTGAEDGEEVVVSIRPGELQLTEVVKPGKRNV